MKRIYPDKYQPYVNAISKSYIRNLILRRYIFLHPKYCFNIRKGYCYILCLIYPWYRFSITKMIYPYVYQHYVNAISKSYIRNLILRRYICLHRPDIALILLKGYFLIVCLISPWYRSCDIMERISPYVYQPYVNAISKSYIPTIYLFTSPRYCFDIRNVYF